MTTATERTCTHIVALNRWTGDLVTQWFCNEPAVWVTADGPRCPEHVGEDENARRVGVVEGEED